MYLTFGPGVAVEVITCCSSVCVGSEGGNIGLTVVQP